MALLELWVEGNLVKSRTRQDLLSSIGCPEEKLSYETRDSKGGTDASRNAKERTLAFWKCLTLVKPIWKPEETEALATQFPVKLHGDRKSKKGSESKIHKWQNTDMLIYLTTYLAQSKRLRNETFSVVSICFNEQRWHNLVDREDKMKSQRIILEWLPITIELTVAPVYDAAETVLVVEIFARLIPPQSGKSCLGETF